MAPSANDLDTCPASMRTMTTIVLHPTANPLRVLPAVNPSCCCPRGKGHRRRYSRSYASRSSVRETIREQGLHASKSVAGDPTVYRPVLIVDSDTVSTSIHLKGGDVIALRKFYDEARSLPPTPPRILS